MAPLRSRRALLQAGTRLVGGAGIAALAGCGTAAREGVPRAQLPPANLVLAMQQPTPADIDVANELIRSYVAQFPNVKVELEQRPTQDFQVKLLAQMAGGSSPDVYVYWSWGEDALARKGLVDVTPYLKGPYPFDMNLFYKPLLDWIARVPTEKSGWHKLPRYLLSFVVFYNIDLFQARGVPLPKPGWTWDDFLSAAKRLTFGGPNGMTWGTALSWEQNAWMPFVWGNGGQQIAPDRVKYTGYLNSPQAVEALEFYASLSARHNVTPTLEEMDAFPSSRPPHKKNATLFAAGQAAMVDFDATSMFGELKAANSRFRWGVVHLPTKKGNMPPSLVAPPWWGMSGLTKSPDASWTLLRHVGGVAGQTAFAKADLIVPSMPSVARETGVDKKPEIAAVLKTGEVAIPKEFYNPDAGKTIGLDGGPSEIMRSALAGKAAIKPAFDKLVAAADAAAGALGTGR